MQIENFSLKNFRNFHNVEEINFPKDAILVAAAPNATGKTNFLESIVMLLRGKSFRATTEECIRWGEQGFLLQGSVASDKEKTGVAVRYYLPSRKMRIEENNMPASPVTFYSHFPIILFLPEDTFLFARGPAQRRNFLNQVLVVSSPYLSSLVQYERSLRQRNAALKAADSYESVQMWSELLVEHGDVLWQQRDSFAQFLNIHLSDTYTSLFDEKLDFAVSLQRSAADSDKFTKALRAAFAAEKRYGYTLSGPHRDDIEILVDGRPVQTVLSRGQARSAVIAMKIISQQFMQQICNQVPIMLFDEVLSELDDRRQETLLRHLPGGQIILTCTSVPSVLQKRDNAHLLDLRNILTGQPEEQVSEKVKVSA